MKKQWIISMRFPSTPSNKKQNQIPNSHWTYQFNFSRSVMEIYGVRSPFQQIRPSYGVVDPPSPLLHAPVIKHGLLENSPFIDRFLINPTFLAHFPACHVWLPGTGARLKREHFRGTKRPKMLRAMVINAPQAPRPNSIVGFSSRKMAMKNGESKCAKFHGFKTTGFTVPWHSKSHFAVQWISASPTTPANRRLYSILQDQVHDSMARKWRLQRCFWKVLQMCIVCIVKWCIECICTILCV